MTSRQGRESFELFYKDVRDDLLLQTYALTGDLAASEKAVRDALVVAWHHWRKVSQLEDPAGWVRPLAWSRAQRRHTARWWHRQRDIPAEVKATLDALGALTMTQRRALLLTVLTAQPLDDIAREVGLSRAALERELQLASAQFSLSRDVGSTRIRALVESMRSEVVSARWPRVTILLRAGTARRRSHVTLGIVAAVAATVVSGSLVTDATGVSPDLAGKAITTLDRDRAGEPSASATPDPQLSGDVLLGPEQVATTAPGTWTSVSTNRNTEGDGLSITCQQARYADPEGVATLVRTLSAPVAARPGRAGAAAARSGDAGSQRSVVQAVEVSRTPAAATAAYDLASSWYGACTTPRVQLLATYDVAGLGDAARLVALRSWADPASTVLTGIVRTGDITTTVSSTVPGTAAPDVDQATGLMAAAVTRLCGTAGAGSCAATPDVSDARPLPIEVAPAMIGEVDLPPVGAVTAPWAATPPVAADTNLASTRCDDTSFAEAPFSNTSTRSYLIPAATGLPPTFGLTETVGALPMARAEDLVAEVRDELAQCPDRYLGTEVTELDSADAARRAFTAWTLRVEIDDDTTIDYRMAILRSGTSVAQLGFIAAPDADMTDETFRALVARAMQRLDALPDPA